jgi:ketosteroid isomerase-like protein
MDQASSGTRAAAVVQRLADATNAHDLDALVGCFAPDYRNETPVHPARGFVGRDQVRRNWEQIFGAIKDVRAELVNLSVDGDTVWSEWEHSGTRPDGTAHQLRGVVMFIVRDDAIESARFYLEPVDADAGGVDDAVRRQVTGAEAE